MISYFARDKEKRDKFNISTQISTHVVLKIALGPYLHKSSYAWQYSDDSIFLLIVKLPSHLKPPTTWSRKFWYPILVGSFTISKQVFWYPNGTRTIIRWTNNFYSASVILGSQKRYTIIDNLMNESLSFRAILTKMTFVTTSVASLMLDSTCSILRLRLGTFILAHVLVKCHFKAFVALSRNSRISCQNWILRFVKLDSPIFAYLLRCFFF
jgi:hypothetical protein